MKVKELIYNFNNKYKIGIVRDITINGKNLDNETINEREVIKFSYDFVMGILTIYI